LETKHLYEKERQFSPHILFLRMAREAIDLYENTPSKSIFSSITAITMSALAIEALCNSVGERVVDSWKDFEGSSPKAKIRIICDELKIEYIANHEPWSTIVWLSNTRNKLAHGKPQVLKQSYKATHEEALHDFDKPESRLEKLFTIGNAKRAHSSVTEVSSIFAKKVPAKKAFGLFVDMWSTSSSD